MNAGPPELARRIEAAEAASDRETARAGAALEPQPLPAWEEISGGVAAFAGAGSPLSQMHGLGLGGGADEAAVGRIEDFFRARATPAQVELAEPLAGDWSGLLQSRGFRPAERTEVLVRPLPGGENFSAPSPGMTVQRARPGNARLWARLLARGFGGPSGSLPALEKIGRLLFARDSAVSFIAGIAGDDEGGAVSAGGLACHDRVALFSSSSTLPAFRGRGLHTALLQARLACAQAAGCDLATLATRSGSGSQRNAEKLGFTVVYARMMWVKA